MLTPAANELLKAINKEIEQHGEAVCLAKIVERCTLSYSYAHWLLKRNDFGLRQETIKRRKGGGFVKRITKDEQ